MKSKQAWATHVRAWIVDHGKEGEGRVSKARSSKDPVNNAQITADGKRP